MRERLGMVRIGTVSEGRRHTSTIATASAGRQGGPTGPPCGPDDAAAACVASGISTLSVSRGQGWWAALSRGVCAVMIPVAWLAAAFASGTGHETTEGSHEGVTVFGRTVRDLDYAVEVAVVSNRFVASTHDATVAAWPSTPGGRNLGPARGSETTAARQAPDRGTGCIRWQAHRSRQGSDEMDTRHPHGDTPCMGGAKEEGAGACAGLGLGSGADARSVSTIGLDAGRRRGGWVFPRDTFAVVVPWQAPSSGCSPAGIAVMSTPLPCNIPSVFASALRAERTDFRPCKHLPTLDSLRAGIPRAEGVGHFPVGC
jgi:hypothetical protein